MKVIDEDGNLFGVVNVIDALVVLLVLAVVVAGASFVLRPAPAPEEPETTTQYATLDLGTHPDYVASLVEPGENISFGGQSELTITDVYATEVNRNQHVLARVALEDVAGTSPFEFAGDPLRINRELTLTTPQYRVAGNIVSVSDAGSELPLTETQVVLRSTVPSEAAADIDVGDTYTVNNRTLGTVESVSVYGTDNPNVNTVYVGVSYVTYERSSTPRFAGTVVEDGATLPFRTDSYEFSGKVVRTNAAQQAGTEATRSVTLQLEDVNPETANSIHEGMVEQFDGEAIATIDSVSVQPTEMVLVSQDGNVYLRDNPRKKTVTMQATLRVRETASTTQFKGQPIQQGSTVTLDLGTITIRATVTAL